MTEKLDYRWNLREVMAMRGLFTTISLQPLLAEWGIELSSSQIHRLVTERPERLSLRVLMALMVILDCSMEDLIEPVARLGVTGHRKTASGEKPDAESGVGSFRPKRARIVRPES
ncbi:helix-turn-helix domain-containing protein [Nocardia sp. CA-119907]|uniref:helix-turn-helix domain-containing protein n=1 Tax=Nocardia sp. CA-119907 TaxID=3239973 RepID=UPI003D99B3B5